VTWLSPEAFGWTALGGLLVVLYLLRQRRERVTVSSLFLWRRRAGDEYTSSFWQWLKRRLLLLLQLLALTALVIALARPAWPGTERAKPDLVLVIDGSARMALPGGDGAGMEAVRNSALEYMSGRDGTAISVVLAGPKPELISLRESDRGAVGEAIRNLRAGGREVDMDGAMAMAQTVLASGPGGSIAIFSDDSFRAGDGSLMERAGLVVAGRRLPNIGLATVSQRRGRDGNLQIFALVGSNLDEAVEVEVVLLDGDLEVGEWTGEVPANGSAVVVVDMPAGEVVDEVVVRDTGLQSDGDDRTFLRSGPSRPLEVLIVAAVPGAYVRALPSGKYLSTEAVDPAAYVDTGDRDLVIFVDFVPEELPAANMILISPPPQNPLAPFDPAVSATEALPAHENGLMDAVDLGFLQGKPKYALPVPEWATVDVFVGDGAGILHGIWEGRRAVVVGFDPEVTGMESAPAFPIFIRNVVEWASPLTAVRATGAIRPGESIEIAPHPRATRLELLGPTGETITEMVRPFRSTLDPLMGSGRYRLRQWAGDNLLHEETFGVSAAFESDPELGSLVAQPPPLPLTLAESPKGNYEAWPWVAALAILVMAGEWAWFHRVRLASR